MSWREPTIQDLVASLNQREVDEFRKHPEFGTAADPIAAQLRETASLVRSYCRRNRQVRMSPGSYEIPESLMSAAMSYMAFDVIKRFPATPASNSEWRKTAREQAIEMFRQVANNEVTPESFEADDGANNMAMPHFQGERHMVLDSYL